MGPRQSPCARLTPLCSPQPDPQEGRMPPPVEGDEEGDERTRVVVRPHERKVLAARIPGVRVESLSATETMLQSLLIAVEPGHGSPNAHIHEGEVFFHVLEGALELALEDHHAYVLGPGDAMTFPTTRPHRWRNPGDKPAVVLCVRTPPTF
jgi:mannose-6-phosphate isomerase-like protein (cupin superfamily)